MKDSRRERQGGGKHSLRVSSKTPAQWSWNAKCTDISWLSGHFHSVVCLVRIQMKKKSEEESSVFCIKVTNPSSWPCGILQCLSNLLFSSRTPLHRYLTFVNDTQKNATGKKEAAVVSEVGTGVQPWMQSWPAHEHPVMAPESLQIAKALSTQDKGKVHRKGKQKRSSQVCH